jgi:2,4-dienoyl-CoA reductase-like NADH-dependent reductase (Old Yellow Enzyme family)/thioredoxin reductase
LLQPLRLGHLTLKNRIMSTSHACGLEEGGMPKVAYQLYHEEKAKGGLALTMFGGSSNIAVDSPNTFRQLNVGVDEVIPWLRQFSERVHRHDCALMVQITHLGRRGDSYTGEHLPMIAPSPIRETLHRSFPRQMDDHDIARVVKAFGDAAWRCKEGGLDGLETLAGAHLIGQFLSPATNRRSDGYGGSLENRCRFGLEVHDEIRKRVGADFLVGLRFVVDEGHAAGLSFAECVEIARRFERAGTLDFFNAVYGRMDTALGLAVDNMPGMASGLAPWLEKAAAFKREVNLPVFHAARIADVATARHAIAQGLIDMAAMTRAHIADPHLVEKLMRGEEARIRPCVGATHCMGVTRPSCLHNPAAGREGALPHEIAPTSGPRRRVVVVGGGPAGLEAARVAAARGHQVTLYEAAGRLGGQVLLAAIASWRKDLIGIIDWRTGELERLGVSVHLNRFAEAGDVAAENPDMVIVAAGGVPDLAWIDGHQHITSVWDVLSGATAPAASVVVWDGTGRHAAATAAERCLKAGSKVQFVALDDMLAVEMSYAERVIWKKTLYDLGLPQTYDHRLTGVDKAGNRLIARFANEYTGAELRLEADQVIVEHGTIPADEVFQDLRAGSANDGFTDLEALVAGQPQPAGARAGYMLHRIGDCQSSRNIHSAVYDALRLALTI